MTLSGDRLDASGCADASGRFAVALVAYSDEVAKAHIASRRGAGAAAAAELATDIVASAALLPGPAARAARAVAV